MNWQRVVFGRYQSDEWLIVYRQGWWRVEHRFDAMTRGPRFGTLIEAKRWADAADAEATALASRVKPQ